MKYVFGSVNGSASTRSPAWTSPRPWRQKWTLLTPFMTSCVNSEYYVLRELSSDNFNVVHCTMLYGQCTLLLQKTQGMETRLLCGKQLALSAVRCVVLEVQIPVSSLSRRIWQLCQISNCWFEGWCFWTLLNRKPHNICMTKILDKAARSNDNNMQPVRLHTTNIIIKLTCELMSLMFDWLR